MILGITPARGGSKSLPRKNVRPLCGKPLLAWTIEAAKAAGRLDRYVVSTEDAEIARVAGAWGAEVVERPQELATDEATTLGVLQHVLARVPADVVVLLQATTPIRDPGLINRCIQRFLDAGADSLATGFICKYRPYGSQAGEVRRQDIEGFFYDDGNLYIIRADLIRAGERYGTKREQVLLDREQNIDIDDAFDFWVAEQVMRKRLKTDQPLSVPSGSAAR